MIKFVRYLNTGQLDQAEELVLAFQAGPDRNAALYKLAQTAIKLGFNERVRRLAEANKSPYILIILIKSKSEMGLIKEAREIFDICDFPDKLNLGFNALLEGYAKTGKLDEGFKLINEISTLNNLNNQWKTKSTLLLLSLMIEQGWLDKVKEALKERVKKKIADKILPKLTLGYIKRGQRTLAFEIAHLVKDPFSYSRIIEGLFLSIDSKAKYEKVRNLIKKWECYLSREELISLYLEQIESSEKNGTVELVKKYLELVFLSKGYMPMPSYNEKIALAIAQNDSLNVFIKIIYSHPFRRYEDLYFQFVFELFLRKNRLSDAEEIIKYLDDQKSFGEQLTRKRKELSQLKTPQKSAIQLPISFEKLLKSVVDLQSSSSLLRVNTNGYGLKEAIFEHNYYRVTKLIDNGKPIRNSEVVYAYEKDQKIFELLLKKTRGIIDGLIFKIIYKRDSSNLSLLIDHHPNAVNETLGNSGFTPLHIAARLGYDEIVQILVNRRANLNASNAWGSTPLHESLRYPFTQKIAHQLINAGADLYVRDGMGRAPWMLIKGLQLQTYAGIINKAFSQHQELFADWKEYSHRKLLSHLFDIRGISTSVKKNTSQVSTLYLEGSRLDRWFCKRLQKWTFLFSQKFPDLLPLPLSFEIRDALDFTSKDSSKTDADYLRRIKEGKPTFLLSGYTTHATVGFFWKGKFGDINRGAASSEGCINIFKYDESKLNESIISKIRTSKSHSINRDGMFATQREIFTTLDTRLFEEGENEIDSLLNPQNCGTCSLSALLGGIFSVQVLYKFQTDENFKKITNEEIRSQRHAFSHLIFYYKLTALKNYTRWKDSIRNTYHSDSKLIIYLSSLLNSEMGKDTLDSQLTKMASDFLDQINKKRIAPLFEKKVNREEFEKKIGNGATPNYQTLFGEEFIY